ncbi:MAG: protein translocase subunit SecF [Candidatus Pacearchaeota archaeon]
MESDNFKLQSNQQNTIEQKQEQIKDNEEIKEKQEEQEKQKEKEQKPIKPKPKFLSSEWYDKNYKKLLFITIILFIILVGYIVFFYIQNGDIMKKDVSLTGGTIVTVYASDINIDELESFLQNKLREVNVRKLEDISTRKTIAFIVETPSDPDITQTVLEEFLGYKLDNTNSSIEISGSALAKSFYNQLLVAILIAFIFMAIVVFIIFRAIVPSLMVVFCAALDIIGALALVNLFGFRISTAGIAAFLMLIGYSVDTDTMLTTKTIKRRGEGTLNSRIKSAFKTGIIMTLTSLVAVFIGYLVANSIVLKEIFFVLTCGLFMDIIGTWIGNASLIKWYCEKKKIN